MGTWMSLRARLGWLVVTFGVAACGAEGSDTASTSSTGAPGTGGMASTSGVGGMASTSGVGGMASTSGVGGMASTSGVGGMASTSGVGGMGSTTVGVGGMGTTVVVTSVGVGGMGSTTVGVGGMGTTVVVTSVGVGGMGTTGSSVVTTVATTAVTTSGMGTTATSTGAGGMGGGGSTATCGFDAMATGWPVPGAAYPGTGATYSVIADETESCGSSYEYPAFVTLDLTGDGAPELVVTDNCSDPNLGDLYWHVYLNSGSGFAATPTVWPIPGAAYPGTGGTYSVIADETESCGSSYEYPAFVTMDLTGDGKPDLVVTDNCSDPNLGELYWNVYANTGSGFAATPSQWPLPGALYPGTGGTYSVIDDQTESCGSSYEYPAFTTMDLTGDGAPDLVVLDDCTDPSLGDDYWHLYANTGSGFAPTATTFALPGASYPGTGATFGVTDDQTESCGSSYEYPAFVTMDLTGDGAPDLVVLDSCSDPNLGELYWDVYVNNGTDFATAPTTWVVPGAAYPGTGATYGVISDETESCGSSYEYPAFVTMDLTGDGAPELVLTDSCSDPSLGEDYWSYYLNTGTGFAPMPTNWALPGAAYPGTGATYSVISDETESCGSSYEYPAFVTMDLTGDGIPELVLTDDCSDPNLGDLYWNVYAKCN